jgi:hypothetical protein
MRIKDYIKYQLLSGKVVELSHIAEHFKNLNMSLASFCNYFSQVRANLQKEGHTFVKIGGGKYQVEKK